VPTAIEFDPLQAEVQRDPYRYYAQLRDDQPLYHIASLDAWGLFRYDDVLHTLMHPELFTARDFIANAFGEFDPVPEVPSIISLDPPEHTRLRKLANKAFLPSVIRAMQPEIESLVDGLLDEIAERGEEQFDFVSEFAAFVPVSVTAAVLGVDPITARGDFKRWTIDLLKAPSRSVLPADELAQMHTSVAELREYFTEQIEHRRRHPGNDLVSALVRAEEDDQTLTATEVLSLIVLLQFGGAETPSHLIGSTLYELFENPAALDVVRGDLSRAGDAVEETLRHLSPVHFIFQTATQDVELEHGTIPEGAMVFAFIGSANRDERAFVDPDRFDLDRDSANRHLSFAKGAHYCIGAPLGRLMCTLAVESAFRRWPGLHPVETEVEWLPSFWVRGLQRYLVAPR
jgi:cytochrome P450 family 109